MDLEKAGLKRLDKPNNTSKFVCSKSEDLDEAVALHVEAVKRFHDGEFYASSYFVREGVFFVLSTRGDINV